MQEIIKYKAVWNTKKRDGLIRLYTIAEKWTQSIQFNGAEEFRTVVNLLRNEKPIYYDIGNGSIGTEEKPIGEGK